MKKLLYIAAAAALCAACSTKQQQPASGMVEWTFDALYTRAAISVPGGDFSWEAGDRIDIWNRTGSAFVPFTTVTGTGRFRATAPADADFGDAAFYPSGTAVSVSEVKLPGSYASQAEALRAFPMFAQVDEDSNMLSFKHLGAVITLNFGAAKPETGDILINASSAGTILCGSFNIREDEGTKYIQADDYTNAGGAEVPVLQVPFSLDAPGSFSLTIPVPTGTYALSVTVGNQGTFTIPATTFERANLYRFATIYLDGREPVLDMGETEVLSLEDDSQNWI